MSLTPVVMQLIKLCLVPLQTGADARLVIPQMVAWKLAEGKLRREDRALSLLFSPPSPLFLPLPAIQRRWSQTSSVGLIILVLTVFGLGIVEAFKKWSQIRGTFLFLVKPSTENRAFPQQNNSLWFK